jgi:hypothetical protein
VGVLDPLLYCSRIRCTIACDRYIPQMNLTLGRYTLTKDFYVLNIPDTNIILGVQWLSYNVPKPIFLLETLIVHCLLLFGCVFAGLLMKLRIWFIYLIIKACGHRSEDA